MTKDREHEAKSRQSKAKEKTTHEQAREAHVEDKVESEPTEAPQKGDEDVTQSSSRTVTKAASSTENRTLTVQTDVEIQEQIRVRAFEIFDQRGREEKHDLDVAPSGGGTDS